MLGGCKHTTSAPAKLFDTERSSPSSNLYRSATSSEKCLMPCILLAITNGSEQFPRTIFLLMYGVCGLYTQIPRFIELLFGHKMHSEIEQNLWNGA